MREPTRCQCGGRIFPNDTECMDCGAPAPQTAEDDTPHLRGGPAEREAPPTWRVGLGLVACIGALLIVAVSIVAMLGLLDPQGRSEQSQDTIAQERADWERREAERARELEAARDAAERQAAAKQRRMVAERQVAQRAAQLRAKQARRQDPAGIGGRITNWKYVAVPAPGYADRVLRFPIPPDGPMLQRSNWTVDANGRYVTRGLPMMTAYGLYSDGTYVCLGGPVTLEEWASYLSGP